MGVESSPERPRGHTGLTAWDLKPGTQRESAMPESGKPKNGKFETIAGRGGETHQRVAGKFSGKYSSPPTRASRFLTIKIR